MELTAFLKRIGFEGEAKADLASLTQLQEKSLLTIPFENLDFHFGPKKCSAQPEAAYEKIVVQGRGGICYECNSLYHAMLQKIGFEVELLSVRMLVDHFPKPEFSHMLLKVNLDGVEYLTDIGNGRSYRKPIRLDGSDMQTIPEGFSWQVGPHLEGRALYFKGPGHSWLPRYYINFEPKGYDDFEQRLQWAATNPNSNFVKGIICTIATEKGRKTLLTNVFSNDILGKEEARPIKSEEDLLATLASEFNFPVEALAGKAAREYWVK